MGRRARTFRLLGAALAACALVACADDPAPFVAPEPVGPQSRGRDAAPVADRERHPLLRDGDVGGWTPSDELLERAQALADPERREALIEELDELADDDRITVLRAGLRLDDGPAAVACAVRLEYQQLDLWELRRLVELLRHEMFRPETEADFYEVLGAMGSDDALALLTDLPQQPWELDGERLERMHEVVRARSLPTLYRLRESDDAWTRWVAGKLIWQITRFSDRLAFARPAPAANGSPSPSRDLETSRVDDALLRRLARDFLNDDLHPLEWKAVEYAWYRQLHAGGIGPGDAPVLVRIASRLDDWPHEVDWTHVVMALGRLRDPVSHGYLVGVIAEYDAPDAGSGSVPGVAEAALARRGDPVQLGKLALEAATDGTALAVLLEADGAQAVDALLTRIVKATDEEWGDTVACLAAAQHERHLYRFAWDPASLASLERRAAASGAPARRLLTLAEQFPSCRTRRMAEAVLSGLEHESLATLEYLNDEAVALLEVATPGRFRDLLRARLEDTDAVSSDVAHALLLRLGDPRAGPALVRWLIEEQPGRGFPGYGYLGRSSCPEVIAYLERVAEHDRGGVAYEELAVARGLAEAPAELLSLDPPRESRDLLLAGRPVDALAALLEDEPDERHDGVGDVNDPRVRAYLERLRARRDLGLYAFATAELAIMGDPGARGEMLAAVDEGRNKWLYNLGARQQTLGYDFELIARRMTDHAALCCSADETVFGGVFGVDVHDWDPDPGMDRLERLWRRADGRFVWSRLVEHFVPVPR